MRDVKLNVLDHGYVRLVNHMGSDLDIVRAARVSHNADWRKQQDGGDDRLINYLMKNHHTSPFESVVFTFEVCAPIFVLRQWHRHRTWSYNEVSARYTELPSMYYVPEPHLIGTPNDHNKQSRDVLTPEAYKALPVGRQEEIDNCLRSMREANDNAFEQYAYLRAQGVPRELARSVLPVATYSRMFATVDLHNLFHFLRLRAHAHAQYEIQVYAEAMLAMVRLVAPVACKAFCEHVLQDKAVCERAVTALGTLMQSTEASGTETGRFSGRGPNAAE